MADRTPLRSITSTAALITSTSENKYPDRDQPVRAVILIVIAIERGPIKLSRGIVDPGGSNPTAIDYEHRCADHGHD